MKRLRMCDLFATFLVAGVLYSGCMTPDLAEAQNTQCSDRPSSDSSNACANTRFVANAFSGAIVPDSAVSHQGAASGTLTTVVKNKFNEVVDIQDYALNDGTVQTSGIGNAVSAWQNAANGNALTIGKGTYRASPWPNLLSPKNSIIGKGKPLLISNSAKAFQLVATSPAYYFDQTISSVILSGDSTLSTDAVLYLDRVHQVKLVDLTICQAAPTANGIQLNWSVSASIIRPIISHTPDYPSIPCTAMPLNGIALGSGSISATSAGQTYIENPVIEFVGGYGISLTNAFGTVISGGTSESNVGGLFIDSPSFNNVVTGLDMEANTTRDARILGDRNKLINVDASSPVSEGGVTIAGGNSNEISGGRYYNINITAGATNTVIINAVYMNTFTDNGVNTTRINVCNTSGVCLPDRVGSIGGYTNWSVIYANGSGVLTSTAALTDGQIVVGQTGAAPTAKTLSKDCTLDGAGVITCLKTNGVLFAASATTDTTIATNIISGQFALARFPNIAANTALVNATSGSAVPTAFSMPSCSTVSSALIWTTNTGFGCNSAITASTMPTTGLTGTLQAAQEPAHTGDVTNSAGSLALIIGATKVTSAMLNADVFSTAHTWAVQQTFVAPILGAATGTSFNGNIWTTGTGTLTFVAGKTLLIDNTLELAGTDSTKMTFPNANDIVLGAAAAQSISGLKTFQDSKFGLAGSSSGTQLYRAAAAASGTIVWPAGTIDFSFSGGASQVVKQTSVGGIFTVAQLAAGDISGLAASATTDTTNASNISSGTLPAARLPNPSSSTLGGIQSFAAITSQWIRSISTSGVPAASQPAFTDISGSVAAAQMPALTGACTTSAGAVATTCLINTQLLLSLPPSLMNLTFAGGPYYIANGASTSETAVSTPLSSTQTIKNLYAKTATAPGGSDTHIVVVRKNGSDTTVTCTITGAATTCNDTTHSVAFAAGDLIAVKLTLSTTAATTGSVQYGLTSVTTTP